MEIGNWLSTIYLKGVNIYEELQWRGLIADCTDNQVLVEGGSVPPNDPGLWHREKITLYCGFDPTADSLHVGNLVPLLALRRFQLLGHHPIAVAGGATGSIGDPSGKSQERQLLTREVLDHNIARVKTQLAKLLDFETKENPARLLDNASWTQNVSFLDFLRDIGKHFSVNQMVAKESVRARMDDREVGISYTEFSYMLLQAFDFYWLATQKDEKGNPYNCELQIGGSDQWGNITAGIDLIRKKAAAAASMQSQLNRTSSLNDLTNVNLPPKVFGLTLPLITNADGSKFGKTVAGAIWLDSEKTSGEDFYQFWIRTDDRDVIRYLKFFTFISQEDIAVLEKKKGGNPGAREAHKALAKAVTDLIHPAKFDAGGTSVSTQGALIAADIIYHKLLENFSEADFENLVKHGHSKEIERSLLEEPGIHLAQLLFRVGLSRSVSEARQDIGVNKGIKVGSMYDIPSGQPPRLQSVINPIFPVKANHLIFNRYLLLRKGKKNYVVVTAK